MRSKYKQLTRRNKMKWNTSSVLNEYYDNLYLNNIATEEEIQLVTNICGWNLETFNSILYARTGFNSWEQYENQ
tara:strand:- start:184 stop:405 length:222 start_codon:yes stop_codon:yes gene_type:complete